MNCRNPPLDITTAKQFATTTIVPTGRQQEQEARRLFGDEGVQIWMAFPVPSPDE